MTYTTEALGSVTPYEGVAFGRIDFRRLFLGTVGVGIGLFSAGFLIVAMAATWMRFTSMTLDSEHRAEELVAQTGAFPPFPALRDGPVVAAASRASAPAAVEPRGLPAPASRSEPPSVVASVDRAVPAPLGPLFEATQSPAPAAGLAPPLPARFAGPGLAESPPSSAPVANEPGPPPSVLPDPNRSPASPARLASLEPAAEAPGAGAPHPSAGAEVGPQPPAATVEDAVPLPPRRPALPSETAAKPPLTAAPQQLNAPVPRLSLRERLQGAGVGADSAANPPRSGGQSFFEMLFGGLSRPASSPALAYARPEDGRSGGALSQPGPTVPGTDARTAIYDIAAHTVYMPNGERLEAHSGLGNRFDDPGSVAEKDRGATPPHVYDLELRRELFHGVAALRMNPVGEGTMFGRDGILAHSYMLGPRGDSNGCVSFKDYPRFLHAFLSGQVSRLVVVTHLASAPWSFASARR